MLRRDVALSYKLLRMVNSAAIGGRDIWSIGHALRLLGRDQVARWLGLLLVTDGAKDGVRAELMNLALVRARMCELLADASGVPRARGPLFLVGMLSVLDQLARDADGDARRLDGARAGRARGPAPARGLLRRRCSAWSRRTSGLVGRRRRARAPQSA